MPSDLDRAIADCELAEKHLWERWCADHFEAYREWYAEEIMKKQHGSQN